MGGRGSGRRSSPNAKTTVEDSLGFDVNFLRLGGYLQPGQSKPVYWNIHGKTNTINVLAESGRIVLIYRTGGEDIRQSVEIQYTACNYGGRRPWFICPGVVKGVACRRRVGNLFGGGKWFLCRYCYNLAYQSQRETRENRLLIKAQKIRERLGGSTDMALDFPDKPKGMHWKTYWDLLDRYREADMESLRLALVRY